MQPRHKLYIKSSSYLTENTVFSVIKFNLLFLFREMIGIYHDNTRNTQTRCVVFLIVTTNGTYSFYFVVKGPAADATDSPQP
jgi:hypothetical protein